jgi:hypothetical protein
VAGVPEAGSRQAQAFAHAFGFTTAPRTGEELQLRGTDPGSPCVLIRPLPAARWGDLLLTGTPVGTALSAPPKPVEILASLLPTAVKWKLSFAGQARNPKYLQDGDVVEATVATDDGAIDLGRQRTTVRWYR